MTLLKVERDVAGAGGSPQPARILPLNLESTSPWRSAQPLMVGLPLPRDLLRDATATQLRDASGQLVACQGQALARWPDGSVRWLLLDFIAAACDRPRQGWTLHLGRGAILSPRPLTITPTATGFLIHTGVARFQLDSAGPSLTASAVEGEAELVWPARPCISLTDPKGATTEPTSDRSELETAGPLRATVRLEGRFRGRVGARFMARFSFFAGTALVRIDLTIHNPQRAKHSSGLWDLGDAGSLFFGDLSLQFFLGGT